MGKKYITPAIKVKAIIEETNLLDFSVNADGTETGDTGGNSGDLVTDPEEELSKNNSWSSWDEDE